MGGGHNRPCISKLLSDKEEARGSIKAQRGSAEGGSDAPIEAEGQKSIPGAERSAAASAHPRSGGEALDARFCASSPRPLAGEISTCRMLKLKADCTSSLRVSADIFDGCWSDCLILKDLILK